MAFDISQWAIQPHVQLGAAIMAGSDPRRTGLGGFGTGLMGYGQQQQQAERLAQQQELANLELRSLQARMAADERARAQQEGLQGLFSSPGFMALPSGEQRAQALATAPELFAQQYAKSLFAEPGEGTSLMQEAAYLYPNDPQAQANYITQARQPAPAAAVNLTMPGQPGFADEMLMMQAESTQESLLAGAQGAEELRQNAAMGKQLLQDVETGRWAPARTAASRLFGIDDVDVANAELFNSYMGNFVMNRIQQTKGAVSDQEMEYYTEISPSLGKNRFANYVMLEVAERAAQRRADMPAYVSEYYTCRQAGGERCKDDNGRLLTFNQYYMKHYDPWGGDLDLEEVRRQYNVEILGRSPTDPNKSSREWLKSQGYIR